MNNFNCKGLKKKYIAVGGVNMKKVILGMMLVMGSLSFSSEKGTSVKLSNIFDNFKTEQTQEQESSQDKLNTENSIKLSNIFDDYKPLNVNN